MHMTSAQVERAFRAKYPNAFTVAGRFVGCHVEDGSVSARWLDQYVFNHRSLEDRAQRVTLEDKQLRLRAQKARYEIEQANHDQRFWESMNRQQHEVRDEQGIPYGNPNFGRIRPEDLI